MAICAAAQADKQAEAGDTEGHRTRLSILEAIKELQRTRPRRDGLRTEHGQPCSSETFILVDPPMSVKNGTVGRSLGNVVSDPLGIEFGAVH